MKRYCIYILTVILAGIISSCHSLDDDRIPYAPVRIPFATDAMWEIYGVPGALQHKRFIIGEGMPAGYPYTSLTYTGFAGVLLCGDILGNPVSYDLSCPVERSKTVMIIVDEEASNAYCPKCHSVYDIFSNYGVPVAGEAAERGYALRRYAVTTGMQGEKFIITN